MKDRIKFGINLTEMDLTNLDLISAENVQFHTITITSHPFPPAPQVDHNRLQGTLRRLAPKASLHTSCTDLS